MKTNEAGVGQGPKHGDMRVWHIPQVPGKPFYVHVQTLVEARIVIDALAEYDQFQLDNRIKPDYCNAAGLSVFNANDDDDGKSPGGCWLDWYSDEAEEFDHYDLKRLRSNTPAWENAR